MLFIIWDLKMKLVQMCRGVQWWRKYSDYILQEKYQHKRVKILESSNETREWAELTLNLQSEPLPPVVAVRVITQTLFMMS